MADNMDDSDAFEKMLVLGLGLLAASVARKAASGSSLCRSEVKVKVKVGAKLNRFRFALGRKMPSL